MLRRRAATTAVLGAALALLAASPASALDDGQPPVAAESDQGTVSVTVVGTGVTVEGETFTTSRVQHTSPVCWYSRGMSGYEYYEYWKPGGPARQAGTLDAFAYQGLLNPGYEDHATDTEGYWYGAQCTIDAPTDYATSYRATHPAVYWVPGQPTPAAQTSVDPRQLAEIAYSLADLPAGTIDWNPRAAGIGATSVNLDTWVWVDHAPRTVSVTASVPGTWARVDAVLDHVELSAQGAAPVTCQGPGIAWTPGATSSPCSIRFTRSSAGLPIVAGQSVPTSTLNLTAVWTATWVSSLTPTPAALASQQVTATTQIPVTEIQALVTSG